MRCGVFLCECGGNISDVLDLRALAELARPLDGVVDVRIEQFLCGTRGHRRISAAVEERGLDRVVVGSCSPRFQGPTFQRIVRELGLGENAVAFANLREGCSLVHRDDPPAAQHKAALLVRAAVGRAARQHDLPRRRTFLHRSVLIIGGGIAGLTAAEELAAAGLDVHLIEKEASLGGSMARLSKTFPTEDCAMCSLAPRLTDAALSARIHIHTLTAVTSLDGPPGELTVGLLHRPRHVTETCIGCGRCSAVCPVRYPDSFNAGLAERTAIWRPFSNAVPAIYHVDDEQCSRCGVCVRACPADAIDLEQTATTEELTVGAVIIATGHQEFDARRKTALGYGRFANVLTQGQLAHLLSAAGPTAGEVLRPSDDRRPRRVLMLQCVGSRDCTSSGNAHCSAICCLFATLHASLLTQLDPGVEVTIGYTDLRAPGKAHEEYYRLAQSRGVRYVRGRVGELIEEADAGLRARFEDSVTGRKYDEVFDLVVLSAGLEASPGTREIALVAGLQTDAAGFIRESHPKLRPVDTQRGGIFVCGTAQGPKTIPESIAQAKAAAARVIALLSAGYVLTPTQVATPDPDLCVGCGTCESVCPLGAVVVTGAAERLATVDPTICRGCGICAADCPSGAMQVGGFSDAELLAEVAT